MSQTLVMSIAIPFFLFGAGALWPALGLASSFREQVGNKESRARLVLTEAALNQLKQLRVLLDEVFRKVDAGEDHYMNTVEPANVTGPSSQFVRLMRSRDDLARYMRRTLVILRLLFWILIPFAAAMFSAIVLGVFIEQLGWGWAGLALGFGGGLLVVGGLLFIVMLDTMRRLDDIHARVSRLVADSGDVEFVDPEGAG